MSMLDEIERFLETRVVEKIFTTGDYIYHYRDLVIISETRDEIVLVWGDKDFIKCEKIQINKTSLTKIIKNTQQLTRRER